MSQFKPLFASEHNQTMSSSVPVYKSLDAKDIHLSDSDDLIPSRKVPKVIIKTCVVPLADGRFMIVLFDNHNLMQDETLHSFNNKENGEQATMPFKFGYLSYSVCYD